MLLVVAIFALALPIFGAANSSAIQSAITQTQEPLTTNQATLDDQFRHPANNVTPGFDPGSHTYESVDSVNAEANNTTASETVSGDAEVTPAEGYIGIVPLTEVDWTPIVTSPQMLAEQIALVPADGITYRIRIAFPGNTALTTGTQISTIQITGGQRIILDSNTATNQTWNRNQTAGRHIVVSGGSVLELRNVTLSRTLAFHNAIPAVISGGVTAIGADTHLIMQSGSTISNNHSETGGGGNTNGGGVFLQATADFEMHPGALISNNRAAHAGGLGIYSGSTAVIEGGSISGNIATSGGGGINMAGANSDLELSGGEIIGNLAAVDGGGVRVDMNARSVEMSGGTIADNTAGGNGGGIALHSFNNTFIMTGGTIGDEDSNYGNQAINGGGVSVEGILPASEAGADFIMEGGTITGNTATGTGNTQGGGGVFVSGGTATNSSRFIIESTGTAEITNNYALNGAGVHVAGTVAANTLFTISSEATNTIISGNRPLDTQITQNSTGHGVRVSGGTFTMNAGTIEANNRAEGATGPVFGNGVEVSGTNSRFNMSAGTIRGHAIPLTVPDNSMGGGVRVIDSAIFNMSNTAHIYNNTTGHGGGVRVANDATFNMTGGTIGHIDPNYGNKTDLQGAGVNTGNEAIFNMSGDAEILNNEAEGTGGGAGIFSGAVFTMSENAQIEGNFAADGGGVAVLGNPARPTTEFRMNKGTITDNRAVSGGGVFVGNNGAVFELYEADQKTIIGNEAEEDGGGIYLTETATMTMDPISEDSLSITNNTAGHMGGGIYTERIGAQGYTTPLNMSQAPTPYSNLLLRNVYFNNNTADTSEIPPIDVLTDITNITFDSTSAFWHPINNYDINFRQPHSPPTGLTLGSTSTLPVIIAALVFVGLVCFYWKRHRDKEVQLILSAEISGQARDDKVRTW